MAKNKLETRIERAVDFDNLELTVLINGKLMAIQQKYHFPLNSVSLTDDFVEELEESGMDPHELQLAIEKRRPFF